MIVAITALEDLLKKKEQWLDEGCDDYDEISTPLIVQNILDLKKAVEILLQFHRKEKLFIKSKNERLEYIKKYVCKRLGIHVKTIDTKGKIRYVAEARQIMFRIYMELFLKEYRSYNACYTDIGNFFNRDRNTIRSGINTTKDVRKLNELSLRYARQIVNDI